jgi:heterotetrameric sarcosine oxidase delta subunit
MALDDAEWADFLFMRRNERGRQVERWYHVAGCRRWFTIERDSLSHASIEQGSVNSSNQRKAAR